MKQKLGHRSIIKRETEKNETKGNPSLVVKWVILLLFFRRYTRLEEGTRFFLSSWAPTRDAHKHTHTQRKWREQAIVVVNSKHAGKIYEQVEWFNRKCTHRAERKEPASFFFFFFLSLRSHLVLKWEGWWWYQNENEGRDRLIYSRRDFSVSLTCKQKSLRGRETS